MPIEQARKRRMHILRIEVMNMPTPATNHSRTIRLTKRSGVAWSFGSIIRKRPARAVLFVLAVVSSPALAGPVDLSLFDTVDSTVSIFGPGNASARVTEYSSFGPVGLWELDLFIPADAGRLRFNFELVVPAGNEDYFDFYFGDLAGPYLSFGGLEDVYSGSVDESLAAYRGGTLSLAFALNYGFDDSGFDSILTISDVRLSQQAAVPTPGILALFTVGWIGWRTARRFTRGLSAS